MPEASATSANQALLRSLPSIDALLRTAPGQALRNTIGAEHTTLLARVVTEELRKQILEGELETSDGDPSARLLEKAEHRLAALLKMQIGAGIHRVINATGVI